MQSLIKSKFTIEGRHTQEMGAAYNYCIGEMPPEHSLWLAISSNEWRTFRRAKCSRPRKSACCLGRAISG
jgi:hypothetical protein